MVQDNDIKQACDLADREILSSRNREVLDATTDALINLSKEKAALQKALQELASQNVKLVKERNDTKKLLDIASIVFLALFIALVS